MVRLRALLIASLLGLVVAACGGSSSNSGSSGGSGTGGTAPVNPCTTALTEDTAPIAAVGAAAQSGAPPIDKKTLIDGDPRGRLAEAVALNRKAVRRRSPTTSATSPCCRTRAI